MDPIRAASIRMLYQIMRNSGISGLIVTLTIIGTAWEYSGGWIILSWTVVQTVTQLLREVLVHAFRRRQPPDAELERWARLHVIYMALTGIVWGATIFLFAHPEEPITIALTLCCLYGVSSGSVASQAPNPPSLYAMVIPIFGAVLVRMFMTGVFGNIMVALASALFGVMMIRFCRAQSRTIAEGIRIRFENVALVEALTIEKAAAEKARHDAESASLAKSQFLAAASHDLRQPLYALSLFSASLGALKLDKDGRAVVENIQDSIAAMESLFVGLLDVSRLDAGVVQPRLAAVSVDALFDRLSQYFHPIALERKLDLRFRSEGEWVTSDVTLLEQVMSNLVSNALRCTNKGGVLIAARTRGNQVRLEVWDTGIGIDDADRKRIFDEFVQLDNPERDRRKGLGLGLAIAQRSAALIGGSIAVRSRRGRGSRFTFTQPLTASPAIQPAIGAETYWTVPKVQRSGDLPVLIVDDDREVRTALGDLLSRWDVNFETAVDAEDALVRVEAGGRYGLVLADYRLPGALNGLDLIAAITKRHPPPSPDCALITGDFDPGLIAAAHARGIALFHKPLKPARLRSLLGFHDEVGA
ncbi:hybrid sensor histidine kinase/response regulator [Bradyrhizobium tropiciagri]|uniref:ATP-binding response regulator n=1 Tax=Bradyrhizobium tropiciagri TaxID=312253 RepID=UPI001BAA3C7C|nr:hybrid sensor histidine kinase/response regulator [Bradyrhizobium tropiciagri]MBR0869028.1 hybrid sensor histidine kinase/response regulator [Bradyrhizobium tropiciagri]